MTKKNKRTEERTDWSDREYLEKLIEQRRFMWNEDYVALLANLIGLDSGKSIADIGCGLGYLGHTYCKFTAPDGKYFGVDQNKKLLQMARKGTGTRGSCRRFSFVQGSAMDVPFEDESFDVTMCQTLLMHLRDPETAVREMARITKKRGKVVAFEPNNLAWAFLRWSSFQEQSLKERFEDTDFYYRMYEGRKKLGLGDAGIGEKVPYLFAENGLKNIRVRQGDKVAWSIIPPYDTPELKHQAKLFLKSMRRGMHRTRGEKRKDYLEWKRHYMAGGGDAESFKKHVRRIRRWLERNCAKMGKMVNRQRLCYVSSSPFYIVIGEK